ncbi:hypothetical protein B0A49_03681 [Cryomyces minteri]|uniref:Uncharacterized protein n=1 Tax=Cryomyces minteri TaxID=331657 RepID=A0A4U0XFB1_9PEZI|nr:hypothetical protein B0A49_03681 [Cryomyces minteri]
MVILPREFSVTERSFLISYQEWCTREHANMLTMRVVGGRLPSELANMVAESIFSMYRKDIEAAWDPYRSSRLWEKYFVKCLKRPLDPNEDPLDFLYARVSEWSVTGGLERCIEIGLTMREVGSSFLDFTKPTWFTLRLTFPMYIPRRG